MSVVAPAYEDALRRLAINDEGFIASVLARDPSARLVDSQGAATPGIDARTGRLVDMVAVIAAGGSTTGIEAAVRAAVDAGATPEEVVEALLRIAPAIGTIRMVGIAPHVATALDYDIWFDLESLEVERPGQRPSSDRD